MTDFGDMIREALTDGPAFRPEPGRKALEESLQRYDRRARTKRVLTMIQLLFMTLVTVWGLNQLITGDPGDARMLALGTFASVIGFIGIGFGKLWYFLAQNHLLILRELKGLEFLILRDEDPDKVA